MKTIDLQKKSLSLDEVLKIAKSESVFIWSVSGEEFVLEQADDFDREAAVLGSSESFSSFLKTRSEEPGQVSIEEIRKKRGL